ncbi:MAG: tRNA (N(6)-L-threonylcarbamoyladenosine(37)-C(2))-methylthiotransferase MtaB [Bacilli bacterium]
MTFQIYTLGCKVNTYESSVISDLLKNKGYIEVNNDLADIIVINTCSVTNTADNKSMKIIRRAINNNSKSIIIVCGCLVQNKQTTIDGVDIIIGNINKTKIVDYIEEYLKTNKTKIDISDISNTEFEPMILNNFNKTRAFVKIQDGCNNFCTYCVIPYTRGNVRSKRKNDVITEIKNLIENGHKEIVLTGIHTGNYGSEFENYDFANLLEELVLIEGLVRLRISSLEATEINDRILNILKNNKILVDHFHIPLQSGSNTVLKRMNRKYQMEKFIEIINKIREIRNNISITTDVIVGFPGETEEEFQETVNEINKIKFTKLHVFAYSKRDGTPASKLDNQIDEKNKKQRVKTLLEISKNLELEYMEKFLNSTITFLPETLNNNNITGHSGNYLQIKTKGDKNDLNKDIEVKLEKIEYPYIIGTRI